MQETPQLMLHIKATDGNSLTPVVGIILPFEQAENHYQLSTYRLDTSSSVRLLRDGPVMCYVLEGTAQCRRGNAKNEVQIVNRGDIVHVPVHETVEFALPGWEACRILELRVPADTSPQFHYVPANEGRTLAVFSDLGTFKLGSRETNRAYVLMEWIVPVSGGPLMHTQKGTETFYILDGTFAFHGKSSGQRYTLYAGPGEVVHVPEGIAHTYRNVGGQAGKMLVWMAPAGRTQEFFERIGIPSSNSSRVSPVPIADPQALAALLKEFQIGIIDE